MVRDIIKPNLTSSFLSCGKDTQTIIEKLLVKSKPHSDVLKRLLIINTKDCQKGFLEEVEDFYQETIDSFDIKKLIDKGYIRTTPKIKFSENEELKSYILISFNQFSPTSNTEYRDCIITFDVVCHPECWDIGDFELRPLKILGYIDGILNGAKLSGIGQLNFLTADRLIWDENLVGYTIAYQAVHGHDDQLEKEEDV